MIKGRTTVWLALILMMLMPLAAFAQETGPEAYEEEPLPFEDESIPYTADSEESTSGTEDAAAEGVELEETAVPGTTSSPAGEADTAEPEVTATPEAALEGDASTGDSESEKDPDRETAGSETEDPGSVDEKAAISFPYKASSTYYEIYSDVDQSFSETTARKLDAYFQLFNSYFHYPEAEMEKRLKCKILSNKAQYDQYLQERLVKVNMNVIYLHYQKRPERSELVALFDNSDPDWEDNLRDQAFIQFLKTHVSNPPSWLLYGFLIYFQRSEVDTVSRTITEKRNLSRLSTLKASLDPSPDFSVNQLLKMDIDEVGAMQKEYLAMCWGLVDFLLYCEKEEINRLLWDSIRSLKKNASTIENEEIIDKVFSWVPQEDLQSEYVNYFSDTLLTYNELIRAGITAYNNEEYTQASDYFNKARGQNPTQHSPDYHLGLIAYSEGNYEDAEGLFREALKKVEKNEEVNAQQKNEAIGLIYYAMGVNAYDAGNIGIAKDFLKQSVWTDDGKYSQKARELLDKIQM